MQRYVPALTVAAILIFGISQTDIALRETGSSSGQEAAAALKQPCRADAFKKQRDICQKKTGYCGIAYTTGKNKSGKTTRAYTGCSSSHADKPATYGKGKVLSNEPYRPSWTSCFFSSDPTCSGSSGSGGGKTDTGSSWFGGGGSAPKGSSFVPGNNKTGVNDYPLMQGIR